ncbi:MAG TPA: AAA family ATPase [Gemmatimonadaceae bacterium]|nr:AAA family ATPase [Gemmatimonadaceae bacterium]
MRLTKLELHGFKSFADQTHLLFEPGVTAIVGPNGCGKSNVSDAVRWVLGEQRIRTLRGGAKMDEVIFQGSSARRAVNVAEVSLHFDNSDGTLPVAFREVVITRRLSRSGDSDYFLNRSPCRLRDIQDVLRGTGLAADAGVVIESKMIDALLSDRPDERRELFEEAAGVGLYRDRRRSTERRLEETAVDLKRLDDLLSEVQTHVRSLARQRKRAERYAELMSRRLIAEVSLALRDLESTDAELATVIARLEQLALDVPSSQHAVTDTERRREEAQLARGEAEARRAELSRLVTELRQRVNERRAEIAVAEERQRNASTRRQRAEDERRDGVALDERVRAERDQADADRTTAEHDVAQVRTNLTEVTTSEEIARGAVSRAREALDREERELRELRDRVGRLAIDQAAAQRENGEVGDRVRALDTERESLGDRAQAIAREVDVATEELALATDAAEHATTAEATARAALQSAQTTEADRRGAVARATEAVTALDGKVTALESLERERVGLAPAAARLLAERGRRFGEDSILGPLSDFVVADQDAAAVVERFLGATLHAVVVRDRATADAVRAWHAESDPGPLLLLPLDAETPATSTAGLSERVKAESAVAGWIRVLLGGARDLGDGVAFEDGRGAVWLPGTAAGPGPLRRRGEIAASRVAQADAIRGRDAAVREAEIARSALAETAERAVAAAEAASVAKQAARRATEHRDDAGRRRSRAERDLADAASLAEWLAQRSQVLSEKLAGLAAQAGEVEARLVEREGAAGGTRAAIDAATADHEAARERRTAAQVAVAQAEARLHVAADRARRLGDEHAAAATKLSALETELQSLSAADAELAAQLAVWRVDLAAREATLGDGETQLMNAELAVSAADESLMRSERALHDARAASDAMATESHRAELRRTELVARSQTVRDRVETEWHRSLAELCAEVDGATVDGEASIETVRAEAAELREQIAALGPVNTLAIEEHDEELKRLEFLTAQRTDLSEAKNSLQQAIREIDTTARELFLTTFAQVRDNFRQIFMTLFGGGECELRLENPETPLDCDIEIHASPRGKRTQRIHLLSSGERALVALSLLFGIFLTKPSPFCLLDEVDAPLDDQNIGRFVRMLLEFKSRTQFIVITHNPRTTTEAADAVYGVTMQEPGVSSLVGVRLRQETALDSAAD